MDFGVQRITLLSVMTWFPLMEGTREVRSIPNRQSFRHSRRRFGMDKVLLEKSGKHLGILHRNQIILLSFLNTILQGGLLRSSLSRLLLRLFLHHTHFLAFLLGTGSGNTFFDQTSFFDPFFKMNTHVHHLCEVNGCTCNHRLIIKLAKSVEKHFGKLLFFQRWTDLSSDLSLLLSIFFEGLLIFLSHGPKFISVWGHVHIIFVLADESIA